MAFVPFVQGASVNLKCMLFGELCENRLMFRFNEDPSPGDLQDLAFGVYNWWYDSVRPHISQDVMAIQCIARGLTSVVDAAAEAIIAPGTVGLVGSPSAQSYVSYSVPIKTPFAGRSARGRISYYGIAEAHCQNNQVDATRGAALRAATAALMGTSTISPGWTFGIASKRSGGVDLPAYVFRIATGLGAASNYTGSQNSRKPGRGQ